jgi:hypothetical protein
MIIDLAARRDVATVRRVTADVEASALVELRRARTRIAQLERNLTQAMRDSLANYERARQAERRLAKFAAGRAGDGADPGLRASP